MATARLRKYTELPDDDYDESSEADELHSDGEDRKEDDQGNDQEKEEEETINDAIIGRKALIEKLKRYQKEVEESYDKSRKAYIAATSATITGSVAEIVGVALTPVTAGGSLGLTIAGGVISASGGVTMAGADLGYHGVCEIKQKSALHFIHEDIKKVGRIQTHGQELKEHLLSCFGKKNTEAPINFKDKNQKVRTSIKVILLGYEGAKTTIRTDKVITTLNKGGKAPDIGVDVIKAVTEVQKTATTFGPDVAKTVKRIAKVRKPTDLIKAVQAVTKVRSFVGAWGIVGAATSVICLPWDIGILAKASYDVHKYKRTNKSNSNVAKTIGLYIEALEENLVEMERKKTLEQTTA